MKYPENISQVAALQPDYLGFIFYDKSPRYFDGNIPKLPKSIQKTGVFVDESIDFMLSKIETYDLQAVQLHGSESAEFCATLRQFERSREQLKSSEMLKRVEHDENTVEIIKVFSIKDTFDFSVLKDYEAVCDYFLFDTKGKNKGGNGYTFDWTVLEQYNSTKPYFLSGGIGLEELDNISTFLSKPESRYCYALDVNSKFEIDAGLKKVEALKEFKKTIIR